MMVRHLKRLKSSRLGRVQAFPMYGGLGMSAPSLHRESTDSLIGLVLACLLSGSTDVTASPSRCMTQLSGIPILSSVLIMHVGNLYIPPENILLYLSCLLSYSHSDKQHKIHAHTCIHYYPNPLLFPLLHPYFPIVAVQ